VKVPIVKHLSGKSWLIILLMSLQWKKNKHAAIIGYENHQKSSGKILKIEPVVFLCIMKTVGWLESPMLLFMTALK